jgi:hypothetical protein
MTVASSAAEMESRAQAPPRRTSPATAMAAKGVLSTAVLDVKRRTSHESLENVNMLTL